MNAILQILGGGEDEIELYFEIDGPITDGYSNNFSPPPGTELASHPRGLMWRGGKFDDLSFSLTLAVGVQTEIDHPVALESAVRNLFRLALPVKKESLGAFRAPVTINIGSWYSRKGHIRNLRVTWKQPYDIETGRPMVAEVSLSFIPDFQPGEIQVNAFKLPWRSNFEFNKTDYNE